ncbi:MAG TPA: hypothetical protein VGH67_09080 [Solirubrobacteraceae bacterium]|jgi:hypothetical protein
MSETTQGDGYAVSSLDAMGEGYGFRKVRRELGVTAFGMNAPWARMTRSWSSPAARTATWDETGRPSARTPAAALRALSVVSR